MKGWIMLPALLGLWACSGTPRTNPEAVAELVREGQEPIVREMDLVAEPVDVPPPADPEPYRLGPNDTLHIVVAGHAEFTGASRDGEVVGTRIQSDGKIHLLMLDGIQAAGRTVAEVRAALQEALKRFIKEPQVTVDILRYGSQKYYVLGHVHRPGVFAVDGTATLLDGVSQAGGVREDGDLEGAYVIRRGQLLPVSLGDILLRGDTSRNVPMVDGDLVYVPDKADWKVYVLGEVRQPGVVPMGRKGLNLADALAMAGDIDPLYADRGEVKLYRGSWQRPKAYRLSTEDIYRFGTSIQLKPGDRILVAPRGLANYNRTVTLMLPFLQSGATAAAATAALAD